MTRDDETPSVDTPRSEPTPSSRDNSRSSYEARLLRLEAEVESLRRLTAPPAQILRLPAPPAVPGAAAAQIPSAKAPSARAPAERPSMAAQAATSTLIGGKWLLFATGLLAFVTQFLIAPMLIARYPHLRGPIVELLRVLIAALTAAAGGGVAP